MKSFTVTIQNNLPPDFCMKNRGLFLRRRIFSIDTLTVEDLGASLFISLIGSTWGTIISLQSRTGPLSFLIGLGMFLFIFVFCAGVISLKNGWPSKRIQKDILCAKDEEGCYDAILKANYSPGWFPCAFYWQESNPFYIAFYNLYGYKKGEKGSFVCKEIRQESFGYEINPDRWKGHFLVTKIELSSEEAAILIGEDETILYLPQKQYEKIMKNKGESICLENI